MTLDPILQSWPLVLGAIALVTLLGIPIRILVGILVAVSVIIAQSLMETELPLNFSYVSMLVVGLLGIEWLARKLLRLA